MLVWEVGLSEESFARYLSHPVTLQLGGAGGRSGQCDGSVRSRPPGVKSESAMCALGQLNDLF